MTKFVPYLSVEQIERDADALLTEFAQARGVVITPPIPIEDIAEKHLKLRIEFDDMHRLFGVPRDPDGDADILGAIFFDQRLIVIDESLDPEEYPRTEGRYRNTLAHEAGHWRLHRPLFVKEPAQAAASGASIPPRVVCRTTQANKRIEWQANFYGSCVLMPKNLLLDAWRERFGNGKPRILKCTKPLAGMSLEAAQAFRAFNRMDEDWALNEFAWFFARKFRVSMLAMRIRLEQVGLLQREIPWQPSLSSTL
jgi:Zn-dependent peptidase ImmA (M78 family)